MNSTTIIIITVIVLVGVIITATDRRIENKRKWGENVQ